MTPLLEFEAARLVGPGLCQLEVAALSAQGPRLALVGDWRSFWAYLCADTSLRAGQVRLCGVSARDAVVQGRVAVADTPEALPDDLSAGAYLRLRDALGGAPRSVAKLHADRALGRVSLGDRTGTRIGQLDAEQRARLCLASGLLGEPEASVWNDPAAWVPTLELARELMAERPTVLICPSGGAALSHALVRECDEALVAAQGRVLRQCHPQQLFAGAAHYSLTVLHNLEPLRRELTRRGFDIDNGAEPASQGPMVDALGRQRDSGRLLVTVPEQESTGAIIRAALEAEAPLVELVPLDPLRAK